MFNDECYDEVIYLLNELINSIKTSVVSYSVMPQLKIDSFI
jgi:hypothetical protein